MRLAQQGDSKAYARLFKKITPILRAFVGKNLNNAHDAEDVVQEILISIHKASHTYDTNRPFKAWMFTIARYRLADYLRAVYSKRQKGRDVNFEDEAYQVSHPQNVTEDYENREYVGKLLDALPKKQRKIVTMMKIKGHTAQETAQKLNMNESAVKVSAHRAYKALAQKVEEEDE